MIKYEMFESIEKLTNNCNICNIHKDNIIQIIFREGYLFPYTLIYEDFST